MRPPALALLLLVSLLRPVSGRAALPLLLPSSDPAELCAPAIAAAERGHALPAGLLRAIGRVESGHHNLATGAWEAWPWSIDVEGQGHSYPTEAEAIAAVRGFQAAGHRSIDVGCLQVNLLQHPDAFASLDLAFNPATNADWAAGFLASLYAQKGNWLDAAGLYHSATPALAATYKASVQAALGPQPAFPIPATQNAAFSPPAMPSVIRAFSGRAFGGASFTTPPHLASMATGRDLGAYRAAPVQRLAMVRPVPTP